MWGVGLGRELAPRPSVEADFVRWSPLGDVLCDPRMVETTLTQELGVFASCGVTPRACEGLNNGERNLCDVKVRFSGDVIVPLGLILV